MSSSIRDSQPSPATRAANSAHAGRGNLNAVRTLEYAHDIEQRVDGRSLLGQGLRYHRQELLSLFDVPTLDDLDALEREAVRRLVKRRVVRELAWGRVQSAIERDDASAFDAEVPRLQDAVDREERSERLLAERLAAHRKRRSAGPSYEDIRREHAERATREAQDRADRERTARTSAGPSNAQPAPSESQEEQS